MNECEFRKKEVKIDAIYESAAAKIREKYLKGVEEHGGVGMSGAGLGMLDWLKAAQEEAIDQVFYFEAIIKDMEASYEYMREQFPELEGEI